MGSSLGLERNGQLTGAARLSSSHRVRYRWTPDSLSLQPSPHVVMKRAVTVLGCVGADASGGDGSTRSYARVRRVGRCAARALCAGGRVSVLAGAPR
jgi:hypothetical protein